MDRIVCLVRKALKKSKFIQRIYYIAYPQYEMSPEFKLAMERMESSESVIDLGCGTSPCQWATAAVDKYIEPIHREFGANKAIDVSKFEKAGIKFYEADLESLPFANKQFDFAYSHHVVEHLDNPSAALNEMQRIAKKGVIMCPSIFAEGMFGRKYHKWLVSNIANRIIFLEKKTKILWFGRGPIRTKGGRIVISKDGNPFDIILNDGRWYHGIHRYRAMSKLMRKYWYGHYPVFENVFNWEGGFSYSIYWENGKVETFDYKPDFDSGHSQ